MYRDDKIRGRQAELGLSVHEVAARAGVNVNTLTAIRKGKKVKVDTLEKVVILGLGMTMAEVFEPKPEVSSAAA